jgi:hypothetical protein
VWAITHTKKELARFSTGEVARKETTLPKGPAHFLTTQADIIMHIEMGKKRKGRKSRDRIMVTGADVDCLAGNRSSAIIPERYIVSPTDSWGQFEEFFKDPTAADKATALYEKIYG